MSESILEISSIGTKRYRAANGLYHREDGPAIIFDNGDLIWYQHGRCHREDGPAIEHSNGAKWWLLHGKNINCKTQEEFERLMKLKAFW
jgi:hypothetical protein